jgi:hypothetical protein
MPKRNALGAAKKEAEEQTPDDDEFFKANDDDGILDRNGASPEVSESEEEVSDFEAVDDSAHETSSSDADSEEQADSDTDELDRRVLELMRAAASDRPGSDFDDDPGDGTVERLCSF